MQGVYQVVRLARRLTVLILIILAITVPYVIGQWIDGDNLLFGLEMKAFWQFAVRDCRLC
jgi:hypothetical protein